MIELLKSIKNMMDTIATIAGVAVCLYGIVLGGVWNTVLMAGISLLISVLLGIIIKVKERKSYNKVKEEIATILVPSLNEGIKEEQKQ